MTEVEKKLTEQVAALEKRLAALEAVVAAQGKNSIGLARRVTALQPPPPLRRG